MIKTKSKSVLVIFGDKLPKKSQKWYQQFSKVIYPEELGKLINPGNIQEANELVGELSRLTLPDGRRISKLVNWQGYELWWMHYEDLMWKFCLPYTQYKELLPHLKDFDKVYLYRAPSPFLFRYFLKAHNRQCIILKQFKPKNLLPIPFGIILQLLLSAAFLPFLKIKRPELMLWTSDKISPPYNFEFRSTSMYKELIERRIPLVVFMRSLEPWSKVLKNAWRRKRAVIYSSAIIEILHFIVRPFNNFSVSFPSLDPEKRFWFLVASHYLKNLRGAILSILAMKFILNWIGVRAAIIPAGCCRNFHEVLGCKLVGIKTVGIQHAVIPRYAFISDFMPDFDGELPLSVDRYGLWSEWWRDYYLKYSRTYNRDQLFVSGPTNPREEETVKTVPLREKGPLKVLFISEQLAAPSEVLPYLLKILETKDFTLSIKFRPYRDGFEEWLKEHQPDILKKVGIFRGSPRRAAAENDVVVGSHSSAVLEALMQLKPIVFFWTNKWGDYFGLKDLDKESQFFASSPEELVDYVRKSVNMPESLLKQLQERFFGDPNKNGGRWVVEQSVKYLNEYKKPRTFAMYIGFPKSFWPYIKKAEAFTPEGNEMFQKLSKIYHDVYLPGDQFDKPKEAPDWDGIKKHVLLTLNETTFLEKIIPNLKEKKILDLGCGRGEFLTAMKAKGYDIVGIEPDLGKSAAIEKNKKENEIEVEVITAPGEKIPFPEATFDLVYCSDVLEHCKDPRQLLQESYRVLKPQGQMYLTVINRFGFKDPHYHLRFVNFMPRWLGERYIILRGKSEEPIHRTESRIKLKEMHYFTFNGFKKIAASIGFETQDLKEYKLRHPELISASGKRMVNLVRATPLIYCLARLFYLSGFRLLLKKTKTF